MKWNHAVVGGSLILLITFNIFNFLNFAFQFSMARMLSAAEYGVLATLFAIIYIITIFSESIQTIITKYAAAEENPGKVKNLMKRTLHKSSLAALALFILYLLAAFPLSSLLRIPYTLLALNGLVVVGAFLVPVTRGVMQGKRMFKGLGLNLVIEAGAKLVLAIFFVYLLSQAFPQLRLYGAVSGIVLGLFIALAFSFVPLRQLLKSKEEFMTMKGIYAKAAPIFLVTLAVILFYSIDIIIAKIVFDEATAGHYAIAAVLAKVIFWGTQPISKAMFPISSEAESKKNSNSSAFLTAFPLLLACTLIALAVFFFIPEFIISVFSGKSIPDSVSILFTTSLAMSFLSLANLFLLYKIAHGKTKRFFLLFIALAIEAILLFTNAHSLVEFSLALVASSLVFLFTAVFLCGGRNERKE